MLVPDNAWLMAAVLSALWLLDYALTHVGYAVYCRHARSVVQVEAYELNSFWRDLVEQQRFFHPRMLVVLPLFALLGWLLAYVPRPFAQAGFAAVIAVNLYITACHIANIASFRFLYGTELQGRLRTTVCASAWRHVLQLLGAILLVGFVAISAPSPAAIGAVCGLLLLMVRFIVLALRSRRASS
jgi:hypothetical protein